MSRISEKKKYLRVLVGTVATSLMACLAPKTKVNKIIYKTKDPFQGKDTQAKNSSSFNNKRMDRIP
jgi:hypothetical protein